MERSLERESRPPGVTLVIADVRDEAADEFVGRFSPGRAVTVSGLTIAEQEWCVNFTDYRQSFLRLGNRTYGIDDIDAVVSLTPVIHPEELLSVAEGDREYVARELGAFLTYFGHQFPGRGINRPSIGNLLGCNWRHEKWLLEARRCGFQTSPLRRSTEGVPPTPEHSRIPSQSITLIGDSVVGRPPDAKLLGLARCLRQRAKLDYLRVHYTPRTNDYLFRGVDLRPAVDEPEVARQIIKNIQL